MAAVVAQPQASRAGLIGTIVVSLLLNGLLALGYFKQSSETVKLQGQLADIANKYAEAVTEPAMGSAEYTNLKQQAKAAGGSSVYDVLSDQRSELAVLVVGQPMTSPQVAQRAEQSNRQANLALQAAAGKAGLTVPAGGSLIETLGRWPAIVDRLVEQREHAKRETAAREERIKLAESANQAALAAKDKAIAEVRAEVSRADDRLAALQAQHDKALNDVQAGANQVGREQARQLAETEVAAAQKDRDNADLRKEVTILRAWLAKFKANPLTRETGVRIPAGEIKVVAGNECFINLGKGDQIPVGMTFEVYDAAKGIPHLADGFDAAPARLNLHAAAYGGSLAGAYESELPRGKGSIEVVSVSPGHTAECKIVRVEPGEMIALGDVIANLVYNRSVRFNFFLYGDFNLGRKGNSAHGNDIRGLIEEWGGQVQETPLITPDTDFVVVGAEPQMPRLSEDERQTPDGVYKMDQFNRRLEAYRAVLDRAAGYGIPVLNQTRFLLYTGFYDQATH